ncbi:MAG: carbonic anhydrase [Micavibrio aeruginosavorus]|uniref:Carbonic anhydrase n=1 Tax=Micavibrio aeruginosavorus TaxID=349221 RepID=A0A7T5R125_9BACT|nr:MAG: carbonic anhydrase [Micavibrio aeruginosavorus]
MPFSNLVKGFHVFQHKYFHENGIYQELTSKGQHPEALVIACCDSRNDPALLLQSKPGEIFVVRNVAAIVPPYQPDDHYHGTSAAIEFAIKGLKVKDIIVLGHAMCGGVQALAEKEKTAASHFEFLTQWISIGEKAREQVDQKHPGLPPDQRQRALEKEVIVASLNNLMTFPWIKEGVEQQRITLHGWYFDMMNGKLLDYNFASCVFEEFGNPAPEEAVLLHCHSHGDQS